ncbi:MAG: sulfatase, partial [Planctomycetes bacterium]|nr:sulfatase [Planctomycetota bacterium]
ASAVPRAVAAKRNVVLMVTDDQSPDMGCYGNPVIQTPNMDRLAADGTRFDFAFCTTASCSASRSVILTGLHNHANGQYGHQHHFHKFNSYDNVVSLPVYLGHAGYRTARCGKYHVAPETVYKFGQVIPGPSRSPVVMANNCKAFIEDDSDRPFFLYICTSDPHRGGGPGGFANHNDKPGYYPGVKAVRYKPEEVVVPPWLPNTKECRAELAEYYQAISRLDQGLGLLIDALKETGQWDDTLFLFLSDNGPPFPGAKTTLYEPGARLPLIVRNPDQKKKGGRCDAKVTWADVTPTILAQLQLSLPTDLKGTAL